MTKGPWKYKKAAGHHHVLFSNGEVLDVENESDARLIALVPKMIHVLWCCSADGYRSKELSAIQKLIDPLIPPKKI